MTEKEDKILTLSDGTELSFGGINIRVARDPSVSNTNKYCTSELEFKGKIFNPSEIIKLKAVVETFSGNKMLNGTIYKITKDVSAKMVKKGNNYMLRFEDQEKKEIAVSDKVYTMYLSGIIQAILSRLPVFVFYKKSG